MNPGKLKIMACSTTNPKLCENPDCQICFNKSFASHERASWWSPNNELKARQYYKHSGLKVLFNCPKCKHEFLKKINGLTYSACPYCGSNRICEKEECDICKPKTFASSKYAQFWSLKNEKQPFEISKYSNEKFLFDCPTCNHEFSKMLDEITRYDRWCPFCKASQICSDQNCEMCFKNSFAASEKSIHWSIKNEVFPRQVLINSTIYYLFNCQKCKHEFSKCLVDIRDGSGCPFCTNFQLCQNPSCRFCYENSFLSNEKARYWSEKNKTNPRMVSKGYSHSYIFKCDKCNHEFESYLSHIDKYETWCPYCVNKKMCQKSENCQTCISKSFATNPKAKFWSPKNNLFPEEVTKLSQKRILFDCPTCKHEFDVKIAHITQYDTWCSYCAKQKLCTNPDCQMCFKNSFASSDKAKFWSPNNKEKPREVFKNTNKKFLFYCPYCKKEFLKILSLLARGSFCSFCKNNTEKKLNTWLQNTFPKLTIKYQIGFPWCRDAHEAKFDFLIVEYNLIIELDGNQHFKQVSNWQEPEVTLKKDIFKIKKSIENNHSVIHLYQMDVFSDKNDWQKKLQPCIKKYDKPVIIFIENNNIYKNHISLLKDVNYKII